MARYVFIPLPNVDLRSRIPVQKELILGFLMSVYVDDPGSIYAGDEFDRRMQYLEGDLNLLREVALWLQRHYNDPSRLLMGLRVGMVTTRYAYKEGLRDLQDGDILYILGHGHLHCEDPEGFSL